MLFMNRTNLLLCEVSLCSGNTASALGFYTCRCFFSFRGLCFYFAH